MGDKGTGGRGLQAITEGGGDSHALVVLVDIQTVQIPCVAVYVPKAHGAAVLYRHEGHGGWMAEDIYQVNPESRGLIDYLDQFLGKYTPDVVLTQVGTNDCAFAAGPSMYEEVPYTEQSMAALKARWNGYMDKLWALLPPDGAIIVATVPPTTRTQCFDDWINEFNKEIPAAVARYQAAGRKSELAPTNQMISDSTPERGLCSDKVHLSAQGYTAMAKAYYQAFKKVYPNTIGR